MNHLTYTVYGYTCRAPNGVSSLGFTGQWRDEVTAYYFLGNGTRLYSPPLMRFISPDTHSPFGEGGIHPYFYCSGDPINKYDPTGHAGIFPPAGGFRYKGPAHNIENIRVFYTPDPERPGSTILNINAHGGKGLLWNGSRSMSVKKLSRLLEANGFPLEHQRTHFIACRSADKPFLGLWGKSTIAQMTRITHAPSTGYKGRVSSYPAQKPTTQAISDIKMNIDVVNPYRPDHPLYKAFRYQPVTEIPSLMTQVRGPS